MPEFENLSNDARLAKLDFVHLIKTNPSLFDPDDIKGLFLELLESAYMLGWKRGVENERAKML